MRYIWLCIEYEEYDCSQCAPEDPDLMSGTESDKFFRHKIVTRFVHSSQQVEYGC